MSGYRAGAVFGLVVATLLVFCPREKSARERQADADKTSWQRLTEERNRLTQEMVAGGQKNGGAYHGPQADRLSDITNELVRLSGDHPGWWPITP